jgi:hypothetical protein
MSTEDKALMGSFLRLIDTFVDPMDTLSKCQQNLCSKVILGFKPRCVMLYPMHVQGIPRIVWVTH